jgi:hypothetical protein
MGIARFVKEWEVLKTSRIVPIAAVLVLSGLVLSGLVLSGCGGPDNPATTEPAGPASAPAVAASQAGVAGGNYKAPDDLCKIIDDQALTKLFGPLLDAEKGPGRTGSGLSIVRCEREYGKTGARVGVLVEANVSDTTSMQSQFDGLRKAGEAGGDKQTEVPGLGQGAYSYTDPLTGPHLAVYDGNLYLTIAVLSKDVTGVDDALVTTARATMAKLK